MASPLRQVCRFAGPGAPLNKTGVLPPGTPAQGHTPEPSVPLWGAGVAGLRRVCVYGGGGASREANQESVKVCASVQLLKTGK